MQTDASDVLNVSTNAPTLDEAETFFPTLRKPAPPVFYMPDVPVADLPYGYVVTAVVRLSTALLPPPLAKSLNPMTLELTGVDFLPPGILERSKTTYYSIYHILYYMI